MLKKYFSIIILGFKSGQFLTLDKFIKNPYKNTEWSLYTDWQYVANDIKKILKNKKNELQKKQQ